MKIFVHDKMQQGYSYLLTEKMGQNFNPLFQPFLTPKEMLAFGVFEGKYLNDCQNEFPSDWFKNAKLSTHPDINCNYFKIKSRQSLIIWKQKGWIIEPDIRGWFQWYCRYYMGRRIENVDSIQIKRWIAFKRHKVQVERNCMMFQELK